MNIKKLADVATSIVNNIDSYNNMDCVSWEDYVRMCISIMDTINRGCELWLTIPDGDSEEAKQLF